MYGVKIKRVSPNDPRLGHYVEKINELLKVLSAEKPQPHQTSLRKIGRVLESDDFVLFVVEVNDEVAGMGSLHFHCTVTKQAAYIEDVVVFPEFQGFSLGRKTVEYLINYAKKRDVKFIELTSHPRRVAANALYEKLGFVDQETNLKRLFFKR